MARVMRNFRAQDMPGRGKSESAVQSSTAPEGGPKVEELETPAVKQEKPTDHARKPRARKASTKSAESADTKEETVETVDGTDATENKE